MNQPAWIEHAWRELGERERRGGDANPRILALYRDAGHPGIRSDEVAWCAAFAGACLRRAGLEPTGSLMARSYLAWGEALAAPRLGAIAVFSRGSNPVEGHVGFWLGETADEIVVLGGNQTDAVSVARFPRSRLLGLRWPRAVAVPEAPSKARAADGFAEALAHVLEMEGGFTDDPHDPGGPTNLGITLGEYASWRHVALDAANRADLVQELRRLPVEIAREIYRKRYWEPAFCPELPAALQIMHFDAAVNHGLGTAMRMLQEASGATVDGEMGPETQSAVRSSALLELIERYAEIRRRRYRTLRHFWRFGKGWLARVDATLALARRRAGAPQDSQPRENEGDSHMTTTTETQEPKWWGHSLTIWGAIVSTAATVLPALGPLLGLEITSDLVQSVGAETTALVQAAVALAGTIMTILGRARASQPIERRSISLRL